MPTSGPGHAHAKGSRTRARNAGFSTLDIFGQHGSHSSASVALQSSLESRLRVNLASSGSTLFHLTWNDAVTPSGRRICALRASVPRTSGSDCTSWPTPTVSRGDYSYAHGDPDQKTLKLAGAAKMAAWSTPITSNANGPRRHDGKRGVGLNTEVTLASWPTPVARDHKTGGLDGQLSTVAPLAHWATPVATEIGNTLENYVAMKRNMRSGPRTAITHPSLQALLVASGPGASGSGAETGSGGQLNPEHSRYLMGYPVVWGSCADTATRSSRRKRPSSSGPR
jgi:hypothetical protein